jgi:hypothetical protein
MKFIHAPILVACLAVTACTTSARHGGSNDSIIGTLSDAQRAEIDEARAAQDRRGDELAAARQDVVRAKAQCNVAKKDLDLLEAKVDKAEAVVAVAETGTADDLEKAREELRTAEAKLGAQRELIRWRECEVTRCEKAEIVADRVLALAAANVEFEKARAFSKTDRASGRSVDLAARDAEVRECQTRVSHAKVELEGAASECSAAEQAYDAAKTTAR